MKWNYGIKDDHILQMIFVAKLFVLLKRLIFGRTFIGLNNRHDIKPNGN
jgi:hypothetical protein